MFSTSDRRGLTRADKFVLVGLFVAALGLLLPTVQKVRATAQGKVCQHNLAFITLGNYYFYDTYGHFPPGMNSQAVGPLVHILPFVDQKFLYNNFSFDPAYAVYWLNPHNRPPTGTDEIPRPPDLYGCEGDVALYYCPEGTRPEKTVNAFMGVFYGQPGVDYPPPFSNGHILSSRPGNRVLARSHYLAMAGDFRTDGAFAGGRYRGVFRYNSRTRLEDITDGLSSTILYGETWGGHLAFSSGGIPPGWILPSRSTSSATSANGTCPNRQNSSCDFRDSFGLSWGTYGAMHVLEGKGNVYLAFNVSMADGAVWTLPGDLSFSLWTSLCGMRDGTAPGGGLAPVAPRPQLAP